MPTRFLRRTFAMRVATIKPITITLDSKSDGLIESYRAKIQSPKWNYVEIYLRLLVVKMIERKNGNILYPPLSRSAQT
jgi:hypothetical protein